MDGLDVLKVKFTHFNTVRDKKPYTIYEIEVRSSSTITWVIYKRYSGFYALHQELQKAYENSKDGGVAIRLPQLPPKRLTRLLAPEFVEKRKEELQEYLRAIIAIPALLHSPILLKFLEVPDSVRPMLASRAPSHKLLQDIESKEGEDEKQDMAQKSYEERRVLELTSLLKRSPNKVAAIRDFEEYFFEQRPRLSNDYVRLLFQGKSGREGDGGLIQTCGDFEYSHVASRAALNLLCRLLDIEKNKDAQLFLDQFVALDPSVLKQMKLALHILHKRGNRLGAFRIVSILTSQRTPADASDRSLPELTVDQIISDLYAKQEYHRWAERKTAQVSTFRESPSDKISLPNLTDQNHKLTVQKSFEELVKIAQLQTGWRRALLMGEEKDSSGSPDDHNRVSIYYQKDPAQNVVIIKVATIVRFSVDVVASFVKDLKRQKEWDLKFHRGTRLAKLDNNTDVVHMVYKSFSSPYKYRDFVLLRSMSKLENGGYVLVARSVTHPSTPEQKGCVHAVLSPSGYILTPLAKVKGLPLCPMKDRCVLKDASHMSRYTHKAGLQDTSDRCLFTFVAQLDREGILIISPDLLGETNELRDSINNIKECLRHDHIAKNGGSTPAGEEESFPPALAELSLPMGSSPVLAGTGPPSPAMQPAFTTPSLQPLSIQSVGVQVPSTPPTPSHVVQASPAQVPAASAPPVQEPAK